jgi:hypothetical protein
MNISDTYPKLHQALSDHYGHITAHEMIDGIGPECEVKDEDCPDKSFLFYKAAQGPDFWYEVCKELRAIPVAAYWEEESPKLFLSMSNYLGRKRAVKILGGIRPYGTNHRVPNDTKYPMTSFSFMRSSQGHEYWWHLSNDMVNSATNKVRSDFPRLFNTLKKVYNEEEAFDMIDKIGADMHDYYTPDGSFVFTQSTQGRGYWMKVMEDIEQRQHS